MQRNERKHGGALDIGSRERSESGGGRGDGEATRMSVSGVQRQNKNQRPTMLSRACSKGVGPAEEGKQD